MYLYEKKDDKVLIHNFTRDKEQLKDYRKKEMEKIDADDREYSLEEMVREYEEPLFRKLGLYNIIVYEPMEQIYRSYPKMKKVQSIDKDLINNYCEGLYFKKDVVSFQGNDNKYYLLTDCFNFGQYKKDENNKSYNLYTMKGIIHIPETLAILQLIERSKFSLISENMKEENILSVLDLYKDKVIDEVNLKELEKADKYHITGNIYDDVYMKFSIKSKNDFNIIKRLKK